MRRSRYWYAALPVMMAVLLAASAMTSSAGASTVGGTYRVTTTADTNDGRCGKRCSVRDAILAANAHLGADIVRIPAGIYTRSIPGAKELRWRDR